MPRLLTPTDMYRYRGIPTWIAPPLARRGCITLVVAEPGVGKSNLALGVAAAAWKGKPFLDIMAREPRNVLFLGQDSAPWDYANTLFAILKGMGEDIRSYAPSVGLSGEYDPEEGWARLRFLCEPINILSEEWSKYGLDVFTQILASGDSISARPDLVVIDTLSKVHTADENNRREMRFVMDAMRRLANQGIAVVALHHTAINQKDRAAVYAGRGSGEIAGSADLVIRLAGTMIDSGTKACLGMWTKGRAPDLPETFGYYMKWSDGAMRFESYEVNATTIAENKRHQREWKKGVRTATAPNALEKLEPGEYEWNALMQMSRFQAADLVAYLTSNAAWSKAGPGKWRKT